MFKFLNFSWLLKFIYKVTRISGFLYAEIDFKSDGKIVLKRSFINVIVYAVNIALTLLSYTFNAYIPLANVSHSILMEVGLNMATRTTIWLTLPLKAVNAIHRHRFLDILANLQRSN